MAKNNKQWNHLIKGRMCTKKGFSLVELLIMVAIIGLLALLIVKLFTPTAAEKSAEQAQNNVILLADAEQDYYKKHKKFTNSVIALASENKQVERFAGNDNITISKKSEGVIIKETADTSYRGLFPSESKTTDFVIIQAPRKRLKTCAGETKCENGKWVD